MKQCSKCGEYNGTGRTTCFKCRSSLPSTSSHQKVCPKCKAVYSGSAETCDLCKCSLAVYTNPNQTRADSGAEILAALIPLVGIIIGLIYIARGDDAEGKTCIWVSTASSVVVAIIWMLAAR